MNIAEDIKIAFWLLILILMSIGIFGIIAQILYLLNKLNNYISMKAEEKRNERK